MRDIILKEHKKKHPDDRKTIIGMRFIGIKELL